ncbi:DUF896 domain-containing protein [Paenibacillus sp. ACRSA]|uniref:DUF896 domain-containing protein n=1 Tax=Paenibacillus sp. ACRSA TaxID=2918211 RepID=UPI001EF59D99|nr:DUF896 domain-containing protein [Paenibacillus sp. ACRSA]MCG7379892.1 DUF896 domain-containing protein [Paenibacillus sp. ACRSA]
MIIPTLDRINELSRKAKEEGLNEMEQAERTRLRQEYLQTFRGSINDILLNTTIYDPNGDDVTPDKLKQEQAGQKQE